MKSSDVRDDLKAAVRIFVAGFALLFSGSFSSSKHCSTMVVAIPVGLWSTVG